MSSTVRMYTRGMKVLLLIASKPNITVKKIVRHKDIDYSEAFIRACVVDMVRKKLLRCHKVGKQNYYEINPKVQQHVKYLEQYCNMVEGLEEVDDIYEKNYNEGII